MNKALLAAVAVIILAGIGYAIFSSRTSQSTVMPERTPSNRNEQQMQTGSDVITGQVTIEANEFAFNSPTITVNAGQKVKLTLKNTGNMRHDWVVEGQNIATDVISGGSETVLEFTAPAAGEYVTFCSVGDHRARGMVGKLIVK